MKLAAVLLTAAVAQATVLDDIYEMASSLTPHSLSMRDLERARQPRPTTESHVHGSTPKEAFAKMNKYLELLSVKTAPCASVALETLDDIARLLHKIRRPELDASYSVANDRRKIHFADLDYKESLWAQEAEFVASKATKQQVETLREGKCAEMVMWFIHHLTESQRAALSEVKDFVLPLMPVDVAPKGARSSEYEQQIACTSCHSPIHIPGTPDIEPIPLKNSTDPQFPEFCPVDEKTGLPQIWYNRVKRCDWDYSPFCAPCEGIGGMVWGPQKEDWSPMPCEVIGSPESIPVEVRTPPLWPKDFVVDEYAILTLPGRDPCNTNFKNSTYTLYFETTPEGPIYHTVGHTGPSGPIPFPGSSWGLPDGNFWNTANVYGKGLACVCLGSMDPVVDNAYIGPLTYDFDVGAKYIGRERIVPEFLGEIFVADHYAKGPHHFWYDVKTGYMLREWQPFNGLNVYHNWQIGKPPAKEMKLPNVCLHGLHFNISCGLPPPSY